VLKVENSRRHSTIGTFKVLGFKISSTWRRPRRQFRDWRSDDQIFWKRKGPDSLFRIPRIFTIFIIRQREKERERESFQVETIESRRDLISRGEYQAEKVVRDPNVSRRIRAIAEINNYLRVLDPSVVPKCSSDRLSRYGLIAAARS